MLCNFFDHWLKNNYRCITHLYCILGLHPLKIIIPYRGLDPDFDPDRCVFGSNFI